MITLLTLSTLAFASPTFSDGTAPIKSPEQIAAEKELATCEQDLGITNAALAECEEKLKAQPAVRIKPAAPKAPPAGNDEESDSEPELATVIPTTFTMQVFVLQPATGPMVTERAVALPRREPRVHEPRPVKEPKVNTPKAPKPERVAKGCCQAEEVDEDTITNPPSASADGRVQVLVGPAVGLGFSGQSIMDINNVQVGGGLELPLLVQFGAFHQKNGGLLVGGLAHVGLELAWGGSEIGGGLAVLSGGDKFHFGGELGVDYTAYRSLLDGNANAELWSGELNLVGLLPVVNGTHLGADLIFTAGGKLGLLGNGDKSSAKVSGDTTATVGLLISIR